jgi:hypothetical protein
MAFQISDKDTPDPFMIKFNKKYILAFTSGGDKVELWSSSYLHDFHDNVKLDHPHVIWYKINHPPLFLSPALYPSRNCF